MKRIFLLFFVLASLSSVAQVSPLPATIDTTKIRPEEIPSPGKLKELGATDDEIRQIMDFKTRKLAEFPQPPPASQQAQDTSKVLRERPEEIVVAPQQQLPQANIYGQEYFRNKDIRLFEKGTEIKAPDNYVIGTGDQINVAVWGFSDYNEVFTVDKDGFIAPREIGRIYLRGLKFMDARDLIAKRFGTFLDLRNSKIEVTLVYSRVITVNIVGEVFNPGSYTIPAINTAFNALVAANGPTQIGSVRKIFVKRNGETVRTLDVYQFLLNPSGKEDFFLENNDYIFVPPAGKVIAMSGEVRRPHKYELTESENLQTLIRYTGGLLPSASTKTIQIKRFKNNEQVLIDVNLDSLLHAKKDFELSDGDEVIIRKIAEVIENSVTVTGAVRVPGEYEIKPNDRLSDVIERAKGLTLDTYMEEAHIIRLNDDYSRSYVVANLRNALANKSSGDNIILEKNDQIKIFTKSEFQDVYTITVFGMVRTPGAFPYAQGLTLKAALLLAGGLRKEAANNRIEISRNLEIEAGTQKPTPLKTVVNVIQVGHDLSVDKAAEDFQLHPYDQIFVRKAPDFEAQENVSISGEVLYPGTYSLLSKKEKLSDLIARAGGLTEWAFPEVATISRKKNGAGLLVLNLPQALKNPKSKFNYALKEGDSISIPRIVDVVQIKGTIDYPRISEIGQINTPYHTNKRASFYVREYGMGFGKNAWKRKTYVEQANGKIDKTRKILFVRFTPRVKTGSTIYVPLKEVKAEKEKRQREPVDWNKVIENTTVKLTGILTLWLLIDRVTTL